jgi:hypothetical protein
LQCQDLEEWYAVKDLEGGFLGLSSKGITTGWRERGEAVAELNAKLNYCLHAKLTAAYTLL